MEKTEQKKFVLPLADLLYSQGFGTRRICAGLVQQGLVQEAAAAYAAPNRMGGTKSPGRGDRPGRRGSRGSDFHPDLRPLLWAYTKPWSSIESATLTKPAMLAPTT